MRLSAFVWGIILCLVLLGRLAWAGTADLKSDFSLTSNPNKTSFGTWSYNGRDTPLDPIDSWGAVPNVSGIRGWGPAANRSGDFLPFIFPAPENVRTRDLGDDYEPGDIIMHSNDTFNGMRNGPGNITWRSPIDGQFTVTGSLWPIRMLNRENTWTLSIRSPDGQTTLATGTLPEDGTVTRANPRRFKVNDLAVSKGDLIKLEIVRSPNASDPSGDFAAINMNITGDSAPAAIPAAIPAAQPDVQPAIAASPTPAAAPPTSNYFLLGLLGVIALLLLVIAGLILAFMLLHSRRTAAAQPPAGRHWPPSRI